MMFARLGALNQFFFTYNRIFQPMTGLWGRDMEDRLQ